MSFSFIRLTTAPTFTTVGCNFPKMKSERHNSTKYFPGITTRKPQLRSNSWAKLLSQNRSGKTVSDVSGLDVSCTPALFNTKVPRKTCQNSFENLTNYINERDEGKLNTENCDEIRQIENKEMDEKWFDKDEEDSSDSSSRSVEDVTKVSRATLENERIERDHLPPLAHTATAKPEKRPKETFNTSRDSKGRNDSSPRNTVNNIDWQKIFVNGGFRPHESRDLPTRGEINLLKYKTWDPDDPIYCVRNCAKYFGLDNDIKEKGNLTPTEKEPGKCYTSPLTPNFKFYPLQVPKRHKAPGSLDSSPGSLTYLENPAKRSNLFDSCVVPPVTPASSVVRSSPIGLSPLPHRRKNTLGELTEISLDGQNTDEGTASPTEGDLEL